MLNANDLADWWMKPTLADFCVKATGENAFTVAKDNKVVEKMRMITICNELNRWLYFVI